MEDVVKIVKKVFITDCEGPLTLNDNAFEIADAFIEDGDKLFKIISSFDDYLVDVVKKENYHAGDTLKLIAPFFKLVNLTNEDLVNFSKSNIDLIKGSKDTLHLAHELMDTFIVSTSYGQYIKALADYMEFPFENTYHTTLDLDGNSRSGTNVGFKSPKFQEELKTIEEFRKTILEHGNNTDEDFKILYNIFFEEFPKLNSFKLINNVKTVGGKGKQLAVEEISSKLNLEEGSIMYVGDSITDVEPLEYAKNHGGLAISFNGNEYPLNVAQIAVISNHSIITSILIDLHSKFDKDYIFDFVKVYNERGPDSAFEDFEVDYNLIEDFEKVFFNKPIPVMDIITDDNKEYLLKLSKEMRNTIRGEDIGGLG